MMITVSSSLISALKATFKLSYARDEFIQLSTKFIMVNTDQDYKSGLQQLDIRPDGLYAPRIIFLGELCHLAHNYNTIL